ncbi:hypothetical protein QMZ93_15535 [Pantoea stewartii subsp. indologenes]|uniref:hypothetical protein n=1 Tax=Pantoea stewartii TaxID=66269 RepID=UPI0019825F18|nr:hypothetical protein [Pantoea stewartii]MDK2634746.1 hypothetical protein [Pantoea stewartii subsp. indologenes]
MNNILCCMTGHKVIGQLPVNHDFNVSYYLLHLNPASEPVQARQIAFSMGTFCLPLGSVAVMNTLPAGRGRTAIENGNHPVNRAVFCVLQEAVQQALPGRFGQDAIL